MNRLLCLLVAIILLAFVQPVDAHFKARYHVVVDTDGNTDDFLAICMMLASPEIEVMAITAVDGVLPAAETASRVRSLLQKFGHEGIPVGVGARIADSDDPEASWPVSPGRDLTDVFSNAVALITSSVDMEEMPVDIVALGSLTNLAEVIQSHPEFSGQIRRVYWSCNGGDLDDPHAQPDPAATEILVAAGIPLTCVLPGKIKQADPAAIPVLFPDPFTRYAKAVNEFYLEKDHLSLEKNISRGDECVPLYMLYPEDFSSGRAVEGRDGAAWETVSLKNGTDTWHLVREVLESDREDKSIIFSSFPVDPELFEPDVAAISNEVIERHGLKEWKIVVLTNEFHEHLGIYSILGAKMGLRAREYFHVGIDELTISSSAGSKPPVSCMNDGLQVSTGATMGHGTITLADGEVTPSARFYFKKRTVEITIRSDIRERIRKDITYGVLTFGLDTPEYWTYVRELALKYWLELNRFDIFGISEVF